MRRIVTYLLCLSFLLTISQPTSVSASPSSGRPSGPAMLPGAHPTPAWTAPSPPSPAALEPALARALARAHPDDTLRVIVTLKEQAVLTEAGAAVPRATSRSLLVASLQSVAEQTQASLRDYLAGAQAVGLVESYTPFWIFNGIGVRARPSVIRTLAARPDVSAIYLDHYRRWLDDETSAPQPSHRDAGSAVEWNVARVRADQVWASLHISGTGVVVAGMDTGVDWLHPDLQANYRGFNPHGIHNHTGNWFDAVNGSLYPVDDHGHGTHTMGTAVGRGGIGVAPGATWIAVKAFDSGGYGYDTWLHASFQWLLAPGGYPSKAPDVVNCSWGNDNGFLTTFQADLRALRAAGILPVFSNGNSGPGEGTVGSPASLPEAFAVGATDEYDEVAAFSSRGPSPWGEVRPHVAAPGVYVRSSLPGGIYGTMKGTSMAAPHVSGLAALLRSVSPTLSITCTVFLITSTAVPLGAPIPNNDSGWGRIDAFAAVAALAHPGFITGTVSRSEDGAPIAGATVTAVPHSGGGGGASTTDDDGDYMLTLAPATYDLTASAFGYAPGTAWGVGVETGTTTVQDFSLSSYPTGTLRGQVTDDETGQPLTATLTISDTPLEAVTSTFAFALPEGAYTLRARRLGYRVVTATAVVTAGQVATADLALPPTPSILLVDSGGWYYGSQAQYFRQALDDLAYAYDERPIRHLPADVPTAADLSPYDIVVWSAPWDAPGQIGAEEAIESYLSGGGRMLLSGQDVGYLDGGEWGFFPYYRDYLKSSWVRDNAGVWTLEGVPGDLFAGMTITITGPGGADNQLYPDEISVADPDSAAPAFTYQGDGCGGIRVGTCLGYRVVYLSFGFEAINEGDARREVMGRALDWLVAAPPSVGLELEPPTHLGIGTPASTVTHSLRLRHVGEGGGIDYVSLSLAGASWDTRVSPTDLPLSPCRSADVVVSVTVPLTASWDARDVVTLTARSSISPGLAVTAALTTKAPAPILLVDDDQFFEQKEKYEAALNEAGLLHDFWQTCPAVGACQDHGPPLEVLQRYPIIVWWTGYDWHRPVTVDERATLQEYLSGGGRLFLSSQDFLYYHHDSPFSRDFLGVLDYTEDVTPTLARGVPEDPATAGLGPWPLTYPIGYQNWSDGVKPTPGTGVIFRDQGRHGIGLVHREEGHATVFLAFPLEALPDPARAEAMGQAVGWLSWLGGSTFVADRQATSAGDVVTYTMRLRNDGPVSVTASISNGLPVSVTLVPGTLTGPAAYSASTRRIAWEGPLELQEAVTVTYQVTVAAGLPTGIAITNTVCVGLEDQRIHFHRAAVVRVGAADLSSSMFRVTPSPARPGAAVTSSLMLVNTGPANAPTATAAISLPVGAALVTGSLASTGGGIAEVLADDAIRWTGPLSAGSRVTLTYRLTAPAALTPLPLYSVAFLEDGQGGAWERATWVLLEPWRVALPVVERDN